MYLSLCMSMHMNAVSKEGSRGHQKPRSWSYRWSCDPHMDDKRKLRSSVRAVGAL